MLGIHGNILLIIDKSSLWGGLNIQKGELGVKGFFGGFFGAFRTARERGEPLAAYLETILRAGETGVLSENLSKKVRPFFDFRNSLIHRDGHISDEKLLSVIREEKDAFLSFIEAIEDHLKREE